jgi:hypothetical protein
MRNTERPPKWFAPALWSGLAAAGALLALVIGTTE